MRMTLRAAVAVEARAESAAWGAGLSSRDGIDLAKARDAFHEIGQFIGAEAHDGAAGGWRAGSGRRARPGIGLSVEKLRNNDARGDNHSENHAENCAVKCRLCGSTHDASTTAACEAFVSETGESVKLG